MRWIKACSLFFVVVGFVGCQSSTFSPSEYVQWAEAPDSDLKYQRVVGDYEITLFYKPIDYLISKEIEKGTIAIKEVNARRNELSGMEYYTLRIASKDKRVRVLDIGNKVEADYYNKVTYFGYAVKEDVKVVSNRDTSYCALHHFVRTYDLAPHIDLILGFPKHEQAQKERQFIYDARSLGIGILKFKLNSKIFNHTPELILS